MALLIQCVILCTLFTLVILPAQYKNPIVMIKSYPPNIIKRVEELPQYKDTITKKEQAHIRKKLFGCILFVIVLAAVAYFSGCRDFVSAFLHVFLLFLAVNLYDLIVLDWGIFCHSKKLRIPGTEDLEADYKDYFFHVKGAIKGTVLGVVIALLSGGLVALVSGIVKIF